MVSQATQDLILESKKRIMDGELEVFSGPIYSQDKELKVKKGQTMTDEELLGMNWFVQNVIGTTQ
jgi:basic membrane protein A